MPFGLLVLSSKLCFFSKLVSYFSIPFSVYYRIHAISVSDNAEYFHGHCNEMLQELGLCEVKSEDILYVVDGHKGQGYGLSTQEDLGMCYSMGHLKYWEG